MSAGGLAGLESLYLDGCLDSDADTNAAALSSFLTSLSAHNPSFDVLTLSNNNLGVPGASVLGVAISQHNNRTTPHDRESLWLKSINLNNTKLGDKGLCTFIEKLESPYCFDNLYLENNNIHATGLTYLVDMVCSDKFDPYDFSEELYLGDNPLGIEGTIAVGKMLGSCDQAWVNLSRCHLTNAANSPRHYTFRDVRQMLCQMPQSSCVTTLTLDGNSFTGERIYILAGFIHLCVHLIFLESKNCDVTSDDLVQLLDVLSRSKTLSPYLYSEVTFWELDYNEIDDRGVSALMHHVLSLFHSLGKANYGSYAVSLNGNPVSSEMVEMLEKKLRPLKW